MSIFQKIKKWIGYIFLLFLGIMLLYAGIIGMKEDRELKDSPKIALADLIKSNRFWQTVYVTDFTIDFENRIVEAYSEYSPGNTTKLIPLRVPGEGQTETIYCLYEHEEGGPLSDAYATYLSNPTKSFLKGEELFVMSVPISK